MITSRFTTIALALVLSLGLGVACSSDGDMNDGMSDESSMSSMASYDRAGFKTFVVDGRLWVFREGSEALMEYEKVGEPAKLVTRIGEGPEGMTIRSDSGETIDAYLAAR
ncbi:MAG: hypothetical protein R3F20_13090 [Planctomycetota bacterium]